MCASLLLVANLRANIKELQLEQHDIDEYEPLHGIKGHLMNIFAELTNILPAAIIGNVNKLLSTYLHKEITGADLHPAAIIIHQCLTGKVQPRSATFPRTTVLPSLYCNCTTVQGTTMSCYCPLFHSQAHSQEELFRSYLPDISYHAAPQLGFVSLRLCNRV